MLCGLSLTSSWSPGAKQHKNSKGKISHILDSCTGHLSIVSKSKAIDVSFQEIKYQPESAGNLKSLTACK